VEHIKSYLLNTRYWWLRGGETSSLRKKLAGVFEKYDIENIAPGYGRVLCGKKLVERQFRLFDEALRQLDKSQIEATYVFRDEVN
jgi:ribosome biogenesis protein Nip4